MRLAITLMFVLWAVNAFAHPCDRLAYGVEYFDDEGGVRYCGDEEEDNVTTSNGTPMLLKNAPPPTQGSSGGPNPPPPQSQTQSPAPSPTSSQTITPDKKTACSAANTAAKSACKLPQEAMSTIAQLATLVQIGDRKKACSMAGAMQISMSQLGLAFSRRCNSAANFCVKACTAGTLAVDESLRDDCESKTSSTLQGMIEAGVNSTSGGLTMLNCQRMAEGDTECNTYDKSAKNPLCPNFCNYVQNKNHAQCGCDNPNVAARDMKCMCAKAENKKNPLCALPSSDQRYAAAQQSPSPLGGLGVGGGQSGADVIRSLEEDIDDGLEQQYKHPGGGEGKKSGVEYGAQGGGSVGAFGGGANMGGGGQGGGAGPGPYNTDINKGYSNSAGGGAGGGGGGGYGTAAAAAGGGYGADKGDKMDWKSLFPKVDKHRGPAGVNPELFQAGVTGANGLSNFEKVTRKMNEKRSTLLP